jgi:ADP-ribose pyrophosphatase YjhB (NUDIX family)
MVERKFGLGVVICIFNRDFSKIFLLKRNEEKRKKNKADWGNVGGKVELGEKLIDACVREANEEIGVKLNPNMIKLLEVTETPFISEVYHAIHFIYATVLDEDEKIILNFNGEHESDEYGWFDLNKLPDKMLDPKEEIKRYSELAKKAFEK